MFEHTSRYYPLETASLTENGELLAEVLITQGDRIDLITARTLGDPEQFWRIGDANLVLDPAELVAHPGQRIRVERPRP
jgi:hypothetical protein